MWFGVRVRHSLFGEHRWTFPPFNFGRRNHSFRRPLLLEGLCGYSGLETNEKMMTYLLIGGPQDGDLWPAGDEQQRLSFFLGPTHPLRTPINGETFIPLNMIHYTRRKIRVGATDIEFFAIQGMEDEDAVLRLFQHYKPPRLARRT